MAVAWGRDTGIFIKITRALIAEVKEIHMMDIAKPNIAMMNMIVGGACVFFVQK